MFIKVLLLIRPRYADVCRKDMIVHIAETEKHKLTSFKRLKGDYVSENYGIFAAIITADNANSSVRIKGLYDALHMTTSAIGLSLFYLLPATPKSMITHPHALMCWKMKPSGLGLVGNANYE
jgi:hypothetical protein